MSFSKIFNFKTNFSNSYKYKNNSYEKNNYIVSYGIIAFLEKYNFKYSEQTQKILDCSGKSPPGFENFTKDKVLLIQRRNTMGYNDFIRGRYFNEEPEKICKIFLSEMTQHERNKIEYLSFDELWDDLWFSHSCSNYKNDKKKSKEKYLKLNINKLLSETSSIYNYPEFSFPKGRKHTKETNIECAIREFEEETGIKEDYYKILDIEPVIEIFKGSNNINYKHIYYIAKLDINFPLNIDSSNIKQCEEVSNIDAVTIKDALKLFRDYDFEKKNILMESYSKYTNYKEEEIFNFIF
jgi:8-oxo-dGTP pyrophosphatase MutT (NUDIX family)